MREPSRKVTAVGFFALSLVLALAGLAWACTAQAELQIIPPAYGPAGSQVSVSGNSGTYLPHPVEIRWNSAAGPVLAASETSAGPETGRTFSTQVTIPEVSPGVYYLLATIEGQGVARAAFEVTSAGVTTAPSVGARPTAGVEADLWSALGPSTARNAPAASALPERGASSPALIAGTAFLALGAAALSAGAVVALGRKRPQRAAV